MRATTAPEGAYGDTMKPKIACPVPAKRGWANKYQADQALGLIWRKGFRAGPGKLPARSYRCECGQWHLTSQGGR